MRFLKRLFCKHDFTLLTSYSADIDPTVGYTKARLYVIYCPNCGKEKTILEHEYESLMAKQEINKKYKKRNLDEDYRRNK